MSATSKANDKKRSKPSTEGFSEQERAAMKDRATELKSARRSGRGADKAAADEADVLSKIAEMSSSDRSMAERVHSVVTSAAPELLPKLWYGQPAYAKAGKVVCFFRSGDKDQARYSTFAFSEAANLDADSGLWPTSYALTELTDAAEAAISKLVKKAVS